MPAYRPRSLRYLLGLLTLVLALPMLALALGLGALQVNTARDALEGAAREDARVLLHQADALLADRLTELRRLAGAEPLPEAMVDFTARTGLHLALLDRAGAVLRDTRPDGARLPDAARAAVTAEAPVVTPLVEDPAASGHALLLSVPLGQGWLTMAVPTATFRALLETPGLGTFNDTRFPALVDRDGRLVARWHGQAEFVGRHMPPEALAAIRAGSHGLWHGRSLEGRPVVVAHASSAFSGLTAGVGVTEAALAEPLRRSAMLLVPLALAVLALAAGATLLVARRIGGPVARLGMAAEALAEGRPPPRLVTPVAEVNAVAAAMADAAEKRQAAEAQRDLLVRELHHRVKNLLATAQSLATLSARSARDPAGFAHQFGERLRALARTHTLLLEEPGGAVSLAALLNEVVAPYRMGLGRMAIGGPEVKLPAEAAVPLGMVLHELATNAAKYGALSVPEGRLRVGWQVEPGEHPRLLLDWTERGGPRIAQPPAREGFGSQLLRRALAGLPGGAVAVEWREDGLAVRMALGLRGPGATA
jgi:two-component sensor histidine kinase